ncbi:molecular chaperone DnaJ [Plasmodium vinckei petteri]|uniref:DnaJ protein, putative n=1 Tax=Plasmodium vinckei petteri TaxID=138298 RepID=W7AJG5_PLAVN|nr:molecular chaperone DnaJ [Plasmodium vinckei petteri]CAD2102723.1 DnaJ protein, putative [Plasmodium vinckei petteri]
MLPLRILRKARNNNLIFKRNIFTQILRGNKNNNKVALFPWEIGNNNCSDDIPFYFRVRRNIHLSRRASNQDPYTVLGLSRNATTNEIKKQFRLLAKKYHPDINPSPDAKQKMADITAAYELLSDPKKKEFYDKTGMTDDSNYSNHSSSNFEGAFSGFGDASFMFTDFAEMFTNMAGNKNSSTRGEDIQTEITLKFMEAIKGCEKNIRLNVKVSCNNCNGSGKKPGTNLTICKVCNGSGVQRMERGPIIIGVPCRTCSGNGQIINNPCKHCSGSGVKFQTKNITLDIPPGIKKGMQMRIPNQGHSGYRGGKNGHLFVTINIEPHKVFKWIDDNIYVDVPLTIKQCLLGGIVNIPTLNGNMDLLIRPKTYPNSEKVLKGKGPSKVDSHTNGDLIVKFSLSIPEKLTQRQIELIEEFNRIELNLPNPQAANNSNNNDQKININNYNKNDSNNTTRNGSGSNENKYSNNYSKDIDENIPKPPKSAMYNKKISNFENKNDSNIPIPPLPPKSGASDTSGNNQIKQNNNTVKNTHTKFGDATQSSNYASNTFNSTAGSSMNNSTIHHENTYNADDVKKSKHYTFNNNEENNNETGRIQNKNGDSENLSESTLSSAKKWFIDKLKPTN